MIVAAANIWYARATSRAAKAAGEAIKSQASIAAQQIKAATEASAKQTLATVVTTARLTWIDALRDDISEFLALNDSRPSTDNVGMVVSAMRPQDVADVMRRIMMLRNRIGLRLDLKKPHHRELFDMLEKVLQSSPRDGNTGTAARKLAGRLFDREWNRARAEAAGLEPASSPVHEEPIQTSP